MNFPSLAIGLLPLRYNFQGFYDLNQSIEDNKYSSRPESITVLLFADGEEIANAELNAENNWTYTFYEDYDGNPLYKYRDKGIVIVYSIGEIEVANYETIIDGFEITNKYNGPIPEITPPNTGIIYSNNDNSLMLLKKPYYQTCHLLF